MPYIIGLHQAAAGLLAAGFAVQFPVAVVICLVILLALSSPALHDDADADDVPKSLPGHSLLQILPFFRQRFDFLNAGFHATGDQIFQFDMMRNKVIVLSGAQARRAFFYAKGFDLTEGFKMLSGAIPMVNGVTSGLHIKRITTIHKRLSSVQRNAPLSNLIPNILDDARRVLETYNYAGSFDPFDKIYALIFQTTVRSLSSNEIADDMTLVARLKTLYDRLDTSTTPATVLLPWLPTPAMLKKLWATKEIYEIVVRAITAREESGIARNDTLQMLLDAGDDKLTVVGFIMGLLIAGARATGTTASWIITYLGAHSEWREKAKAEVEALLGAHASGSESESTSARLAEIPLEAWEASTPVLDAIIRETLRVAQPHTAMRRNLGPDTYILDKRIPAGAYVVYPFSDVHLDPDIYPDPWRFDPARSAKGCASQAGADAELSYVGWGVGKTTCLGTRLAKLELKLVLALFLLAFDHTTEGAEPRPNWNDILMCRPERCVVSYRRTDRAL
ncbi:Cytochrome P450 [Mycena kentingensis (nom. inval.)]|nr:Cytochrome P450 [Mycena kentingensis (nom. inval.)]